MSQTDSEQGDYMTTISQCLDYLIKFGDKSLVEYHLNHIIAAHDQTLKQKLLAALPTTVPRKNATDYGLGEIETLERVTDVIEYVFGDK